MTKGQKDPSGLTAKLEDGMLTFLLVSMIFLSFTQILLRNIFGTGLIWIDPLVRQMLLWITLAGCDTFAAIVCALLTYSTFRVFHMEFQDPQGGFIMTGLPLWASLLTMPVAFGVMTLRFIRFSIISLLHTVKGKANP
jgi:TRAP-type C4-dicarboxylate transport system permease small subunit